MSKPSEPKYKAWDKRNKRMRRVSSISFEDQHVIFKDEPDTKVTFKNIELLKYIGLSSERRQPICEGDIVTFKLENEVEVGLVVQSEKGDWLFYVPRTGRNVIPWNMIDKPSLKEIEIVGNRFENPDRLSKEYVNTVKLWHMYGILSSDKICEDEYCRHDLRNAMKKLSSRTKKELLEVIERLSEDLRYYKKSYFEEFLHKRR